MQLEFFDVPSPCIGICQTDDKGYCLGCMRTREERLGWLNFSGADRQKVIKRCRQRKKRWENANKPKMPAEKDVIVQHSLLEPSVTPDIPDIKQVPPSKQSEIQTDSDIDFSDFEL